MMMFLLVWLLLAGAAAGLAVGIMAGRPPEPGSCSARLGGHRLVRCPGCKSTDALRQSASRCGM